MMLAYADAGSNEITKLRRRLMAWRIWSLVATALLAGLLVTEPPEFWTALNFLAHHPHATTFRQK